jgi:hypothetical protein
VKIVLILNVFSTLLMVGLIWFVQVVHYPMFKDVGADGFVRYMQIHQRRTTWVVAPLMLIEAFSSVGLLYLPPPETDALWLWGSMILVLVIWLSTAVLQVPKHGALAETGFSRRVHSGLVVTNWLRTVAWTFRGLILASILWRLIPSD